MGLKVEKNQENVIPIRDRAEPSKYASGAPKRQFVQADKKFEGIATPPGERETARLTAKEAHDIDKTFGKLGERMKYLEKIYGDLPERDRSNMTLKHFVALGLALEKFRKET